MNLGLVERVGGKGGASRGQEKGKKSATKAALFKSQRMKKKKKNVGGGVFNRGGGGGVFGKRARRQLAGEKGDARRRGREDKSITSARVNISHFSAKIGKPLGFS